jgi:hypothetical protein
LLKKNIFEKEKILQYSNSLNSRVLSKKEYSIKEKEKNKLS